MAKLALLFSVIGLMFLASTQTAAQEATPRTEPQPPANNMQPKYFLHNQPCDYVQRLMMTIGKYEEEPLFQSNTISQNANGQWYEGKSMMFVNWKTGTYSFITLYPDGIGCMQSIGKDFKPYDGPKIHTSS